MSKGETRFERRVMCHKAVEGVTEDCLRTEANCGNSDIEELRLVEVIARYEFTTSRDKYFADGVAAIVRDTEPEPPRPKPKQEKPLPEPKLQDQDHAGRELPSSLFDEIEYNDGEDPADVHESDATGVPYGDDFPQEDHLMMVRAAKRHSEEVGDDGQFNGA